MKQRNAKLSRKDLIDFARMTIKELGLSNNEIMLFLYGGLKVCPECREQHLYIDRFCPECGMLFYGEQEGE